MAEWSVDGILQRVALWNRLIAALLIAPLITMNRITIGRIETTNVNIEFNYRRMAIEHRYDVKVVWIQVNKPKNEAVGGLSEGGCGCKSNHIYVCTCVDTYTLSPSVIKVDIFRSFFAASVISNQTFEFDIGRERRLLDESWDDNIITLPGMFIDWGCCRK